mgnify:CR=1 FL=1
MEKQLDAAAEIALSECMGVKEGEKVLIITDEHLRKIGLVLFDKAKELKTEAMYMEMLSRENHGVEPPSPIAAAMMEADVIVIPTYKSLSHTSARRKANDRGARIATMPGITEEMMARTLAADYENMADLCNKFAAILTQGKEVEIKSRAGTDLRFSIKGREALADTGILLSPDDFSNLPAGETFVAPLEGTAQGTLVIDGSMAGVGILDEPIKMEIEKGFVVGVEGGPEAKTLQVLLDEHGELARNIAELGIGLNSRAKLTGKVLEDEKVLGTIHIALGDNSTFGGNVEVPSHLDGIVLKPTLILDGKVLIKEGQLSHE